MKNNFELKPSSFFKFSFLFSCACHLFFFSSFIIVLAQRPSLERPGMVFLGAILKEYDIEWPDANSEEFLPLPFSLGGQKEVAGERTLMPHSIINKPLADFRRDIQAKITLKANFLNESHQHLMETNVELNSRLPAYRPLRYSQ